MKLQDIAKQLSSGAVANLGASLLTTIHAIIEEFDGHQSQIETRHEACFRQIDQLRTELETSITGAMNMANSRMDLLIKALTDRVAALEAATDCSRPDFIVASQGDVEDSEQRSIERVNALRAAMQTAIQVKAAISDKRTDHLIESIMKRIEETSTDCRDALYLKAAALSKATAESIQRLDRQIGHLDDSLTALQRAVEAKP